jgi:hypothetical protein
MFESLGFNVGENVYRDGLGYDTVHMVPSVSEGFTSSVIIPLIGIAVRTSDFTSDYVFSQRILCGCVCFNDHLHLRKIQAKHPSRKRYACLTLEGSDRYFLKLQNLKTSDELKTQ